MCDKLALIRLAPAQSADGPGVHALVALDAAALDPLVAKHSPRALLATSTVTVAATTLKRLLITFPSSDYPEPNIGRRQGILYW
jgi:hypothetical protein